MHSVPDGWTIKKLEETGEAIIGLTYSPNDVVDSGGMEVLRSSNVQNGRIVLDDLVRVTTKIPQKLILQKGDILVCARNGSQRLIGKNARIDDENVGKTFGAFMCVYRSDNSDFIFWLFQTELFKKQVARDLGPTINQVTTGNLNSFKFAFPDASEQARIVKILETWDKYLELLEKTIQVKNNLKKGLEQKLLLANLRLNGFSGSWNECEIQEICDIKKGSGLSKDKLAQDGRNECILYGELYTKYDEVIDTVISKTNETDGVLSKVGDVLIPASTTTSHLDLAIAASVKVDDIHLGGDINILRPKKPNHYDSDFLAYYLSHARKHELARLAQGITIVHLYGKDFKKLKLNLPPIDEQKAIVSVLEVSANEIRELIAKRNIIIDQKKYLISKLLRGAIRTPSSIATTIKEHQYA